MANRQIALYFWEGWLGVAPSLLNAVQMLSERGYSIDVFAANHGYKFALPPNLPAETTLHMCDLWSTRISRHLNNLGFSTTRFKNRKTSAVDDNYTPKKSLLNRCATAVKIMLLLPLDYLQYLVFCKRHANSDGYKALIGVDMYGLIAASSKSINSMKSPVIYWSLEIAYSKDFPDPFRKFLKYLEKGHSRDAMATIIQDEYRAESLESENGAQQQLLLVPNSPRGFPEKIERQYFRNKFKIEPSSLILLHIGMIDPAVLSLELAAASAKWPSDLSLIFHERSKQSLENPYIAAIVEASKGKVHLSLDPVPFKKLDELVISGDIGLVLYDKNLGPNYALAGSSGKLGQYLRCGLPVIALDLPGVNDVIDTFKCGVVVESIDEIVGAAMKISENYEAFHQNALSCYENRYEFGRHFDRVVEMIAAL